MTYDFIWKYIERPKRILMSRIHKIFGRGNAEIIQGEVNRHRGELVLYLFDVVKLIGWTDQYDDDYYWIIQSPCDYRDSIKLASCVGDFIWLKNHLSQWNYAYLLNVFDMNALSEENIETELIAKNFTMK